MDGGRRSAALLFGSALGIFTLDRLTKWWAESSLQGRPPIRLIPGLLDLRFTSNPGGAFSIGQSAPVLFAIASAIVAGIIIATAGRHSSGLVSVTLGMILGGALGNLTDRVFRDPSFLRGEVIDFIDLHHWPVFNVADASIVIGAILLAASSFVGTSRGADDR
jgi:signal peptidase II